MRFTLDDVEKDRDLNFKNKKNKRSRDLARRHAEQVRKTKQEFFRHISEARPDEKK